MRALSWGALLVGCVGFAVVAFNYDGLMRMSAAAVSEDAAVWVYTPHVAPGGRLKGEITIYGGYALGVHALDVRLGTTSVQLEGRGVHWGGSVSSDSDGEDSVDFVVTVPADARPGAALPLELNAEYSVARGGLGGFSNARDRTSISAAFVVKTPTEALMLRTWAAARAILQLLLLAWIYARVGRWTSWLDERFEGDDDAAENFGYLLVCVMVYVAFAGYWAFATPLMSATGWTGTWVAAAFVITWMVVPPIVAWKWSKRGATPQPGPGRYDPARSSGDVS